MTAKVEVHEVHSVAHRCTLRKILQSAKLQNGTWKSKTVFTALNFRDISNKSLDTSIGSVVTEQLVVSSQGYSVLLYCLMSFFHYRESLC